MSFVLARLKEGSSYGGIVAIILAQVLQHNPAVGAGFSGLCLTLLNMLGTALVMFPDNAGLKAFASEVGEVGQALAPYMPAALAADLAPLEKYSPPQQVPVAVSPSATVSGVASTLGGFALLLMVGASLAACSSLADPTTAVAAADEAYAAALAGELVYLESGRVSPTVVQQIAAYNTTAHAALAPLAADIAAGTPPTSDQSAAATAAVGALTNYLTSQNIGGS